MTHSSVSPDLNVLFSSSPDLSSEDLGTPPSSWFISSEADANPAFQDVDPDTLQLLKPVQTGFPDQQQQDLAGEDHEQPVKLGMLWQILAERDRNATANAKIDMFTSGFQIGSASWGQYCLYY